MAKRVGFDLLKTWQDLSDLPEPNLNEATQLVDGLSDVLQRRTRGQDLALSIDGNAMRLPPGARVHAGNLSGK